MAAGNIPDQNIERYKFDSGVWVGNGGPDGLSSPPLSSFLSTLNNAYVAADGSLVPRPVLSEKVLLTNPSSLPDTAPPPRFVLAVFSGNNETKMAYHDPLTAAPTSLVYFHPDASSGKSGFVWSNSLSAPSAFVEFSGVFYMATVNDGVRKITGINYTTDTVTESAVAGAPAGLHGMVCFRNRLFGFYGATIYFTEAAVGVGVFPDTWNTSTNNLVVNGTGAQGLIYKMVVYNDRLFIFTNVGIFTLSVNGTPSSWVLRPLKTDITVCSYDCAVVRGDYIYVIDKYNGVWVTNGSSFQLISEPLKYFWRYPNRKKSDFRIFVSGQFLIITLFYMGSGGFMSAYCYMTSFENLGSWSRFKVYDGADGDDNSVIVAGFDSCPVYNATAASESEANGGVVFDYLSPSENWSRLFAWFEGTYDFASTSGTNFPVEVEIHTPELFVGSPVDRKYVKYGILETDGMIETAADVTLNITSRSGTVTISNTTYPSYDLIDSSRFIRFEVATHVISLSTYVSILGYGIDGFIKALYYVVGTERLLTEAVEL